MLTDICPVQWTGRQAVIALPEHIDVSNARPIREELLSVINRGAEALIADLTATISCDHAGADALSRGYQRAVVSGTELRLVVTAPVVRQILSLNGLDRLVPIYPSLQAATAARAPATVIPVAATRPERPVAGITPAVTGKLVDALQDGVALTDGGGTLVLANLRLEEMFGYPHAELTGRPVETLIPAGLQAAHRGHRAAYAQAPRAQPMGAGARLVALRKDGTTFPAEISLSPVATATGTSPSPSSATSPRPAGSPTSPTSPGPRSQPGRHAAARNFSTRSPPACTTSGSACRLPRTCPTTRPARASQKPSGTWTTRSARSATTHSPPATRKLIPHPETMPGDATPRQPQPAQATAPPMTTGPRSPSPSLIMNREHSHVFPGPSAELRDLTP